INTTLLSILAKEKNDVVPILEGIVSQAMTLLGGAGGKLHLVAPNQRELELVASTGMDRTVLPIGFRMAKGEGLAGKIWDRRKPEIVDHYKKWDNRIPEISDDFTAIVGVPMWVEDEVIGVVTVVDEIEHRKFTQNDVDILERFAQQAALVIHNARLNEAAQRRVRDMEIVNQIAEIIGKKLQTQEILDEVVHQLQQQLQCSDCTIFLLEQVTGEQALVAKATYGQYAAVINGAHYPINYGLVGRAFRNSIIEIIGDVMQDVDYVHSDDGSHATGSMLTAAIIVGGQPIGVLSAGHDEPYGFSESDKQLVAAITRHLGIAIERADGLELLQEINNQIIGTTEVYGTLERIANGACQLARASSCGIYLVDAAKTTIIDYVQVPHEILHPMPRVKQKVGLTYEVITTGKEIIIPVVAEDGRINQTLHEKVITTVTMPLLLGEEIIGAIHVNSSTKRTFTDTELALLRTLASQASTAIQKA
ncbi:MAG: GAF domain-containing protein, partial [Caldilineaceae bacterium]|nr:GAF domain-containing protein [Caldilineaceae bacterium]